MGFILPPHRTMRAALALAASPRHFTGGAVAVLKNTTASNYMNIGIFFLALSIISIFCSSLLAFRLGENSGSAPNIGLVASMVFVTITIALAVVHDLMVSRGSQPWPTTVWATIASRRCKAASTHIGQSAADPYRTIADP